MRAHDTAAREELFQTILAVFPLRRDGDQGDDLALEHREAGGSSSDFAVPIDVAAIDAEDADDIHLQILALSRAAGAA